MFARFRRRVFTLHHIPDNVSFLIDNADVAPAFGQRYRIATQYLYLRQFWLSTAPFHSAAREINAGRNVRVRFAPSPTGSLHIGGLRTALYNYLFVSKQRLLGREAAFIVRIEDTDSTRLIPGSAERIEKLLAWAGIECDESPELGGNYGPYVQSKRVDLYQQHAKELVARGAAYYCFCSPTRLDLVRKEAVRHSRTPGYDNKCRHLDPADSRRRVEHEGEKACIRLRFDTVPSVDDIVYGHIDHAGGTEGDPVLMKQDGMPTYHFANVVDDYAMQITHVLRGSEWLASTPKHLLLYRAFGWTPPQFAHLPLLLDMQGHKLSKRLHQDVVSVDAYIERGVYPEALLSFLCSSSAGFTDYGSGSAADDKASIPSAKFDLSRQVYLATMQELIDHFELHMIRCNPCRIAPLERVLELNHMALAQRYKKDPAHIIDEFKQLLLQSNSDPISNTVESSLNINDNQIRRILDWGIGTRRVHTLKQLLDENIVDVARPVAAVRGVATAQQDSGDKPNLSESDLQFLLGANEILQSYAGSADTDAAIKALKTYVKASQPAVSQRHAWHLIRFAIVGKHEGAPVAEVIQILGVDGVTQRMRTYLSSIHRDALQKNAHITA